MMRIENMDIFGISVLHLLEAMLFHTNFQLMTCVLSMIITMNRFLEFGAMNCELKCEFGLIFMSALLLPVFDIHTMFRVSI